MARTKQGLILPLDHLSPHAVIILHLQRSKILQKNALVWFVSFVRVSQSHCCCNHPFLTSFLKHDDRKQGRGHLSQGLKGSTSGLNATIYALVTINITCLLTSELRFSTSDFKSETSREKVASLNLDEKCALTSIVSSPTIQKAINAFFLSK